VTEPTLPVMTDPILTLISEYGWSRTRGESDADRAHRWAVLLCAIKHYATQAVRQALTPPAP
jgi:hypothetical protein